MCGATDGDVMKGFVEMDAGDAPKKMPLPVVVVSAGDGKRMNGMTAAWITQVSAEPPMIMVAIRKSRYTWEIMKDTELFGISVLGAGQKKIAEIFGTMSGMDTDKFGEAGVEPVMAGDVPLIPGSISAFVCRKGDVFEEGDHLAVFGDVIKAWAGDDSRPLMWYDWSIKE